MCVELMRSRSVPAASISSRHRAICLSAIAIDAASLLGVQMKRLAVCACMLVMMLSPSGWCLALSQLPTVTGRCCLRAVYSLVQSVDEVLHVLGVHQRKLPNHQVAADAEYVQAVIGDAGSLRLRGWPLCWCWCRAFAEVPAATG